MNPKPLAGCQWTTAPAAVEIRAKNGLNDPKSDGTGPTVAAGSGLARARATVKPSVVTVKDREHYKRNSSYARVNCAFRYVGMGRNDNYEQEKKSPVQTNKRNLKNYTKWYM